MKRVVLPIDGYKDQILGTIEKNPVTIIVADTGAGKSTRVPQFLLEETDYQIVVTQPRRVAAKAVAKRVAEEMNCPFGGLVGFRTAVDRKDSDQTRCLFATDGLQLVRELTNSKQSMGRGICLVIDEVHEWNLNIETLVAWAKNHILSGADIKVVLMSATLDHERLSEFFDDAPVVQVPGRCFPVVGSPTHANGIRQMGAKDMLNEIKRLVAQGANSLVFLPGKGEIKQVENALKQANVNAMILPLHGDVAPEEQELAFKSFPKPKVVLATNIAQTSLTIPDINAVVDSGLERRKILVNGVETLLLGNISRADVRQRAGRAGRVMEGEYVLCNDTPYDAFQDYAVPEIQRTLLDQMTLRLAGAGFDALELPFFHQPDKKVLMDARELLYAIEAIDEGGNITKLGRNINRFPISVISARMMLEALERKCLAPILTITAVMGTKYGSLRRRSRDTDPEWWDSWEKLLDPKKEYYSDLLVEYHLFKQAREMARQELAPSGIDPKAFETAYEIREQIKSAISGLGYHEADHSRNKTNEDEVLKCIASGMLGHLYKHSSGADYDSDGDRRTLARESILHKLSTKPEWIVGEPMDITTTNRKGKLATTSLVKTCTVVDPLWFTELAPHLVVQKIENLRFSTESMGVVEDHVVIFNGTEISREMKLAEYRQEVLEKFAYALAHTYFSGETAWGKIDKANEKTLDQYQELRKRSGGTIEKIDSSFFVNHYKQVLEKAFEWTEVKNLSLYVVEVVLGGFGPLWVPLDSLISAEEESRILSDNPDSVEIAGQKMTVTYGQSGDNFYAKVTVEEKFVEESELDELTLPCGRELQIVCGNISGTLSEIRAKLRERLVAKFRLEVTNFVTAPQYEPFQKNEWGWKKTSVGEALEAKRQELENAVVGKLTASNYQESVEELQAEAMKLEEEFRASYEKAKALIEGTEQNFYEVSSTVEQGFVEDEMRQIRNLLAEAKTSLQKGEFAEAENYCRSAEVKIDGLVGVAKEREKERENRIKANNVPDYLLRAFRGDLERTLQFMENVAKLPTKRIDGHIVGACGRGRVYDHLVELGGEEFFCGADPNDVKSYVYDFHFGDDGGNYSDGEEEDSEPLEDNALADALRKAGLL